ncbi:MAG TPA: class I SAM-dependent methyltransferase, partial [Mycobacteriales bacterium]
MRQEEIWDADIAQHYDTPGSEMFAPAVLIPTVDRLVELAARGRVLEFAIGTGRVAVPLAEHGVPVSGIELSRPMLEQLRLKVDEPTVPVVVGDMATARAPGDFTLVYLVYNTISNLPTQAEQVACFRNAARHLVPGGRFVIELWVPELRVLPPGQPATVVAGEPGYLRVDVYDVVHQHVVSHHFRFGDGRDARLFRSPHRYIWPAELDLMAQLAGFHLKPGTPTGPALSSPPSPPPTSRCTASSLTPAVPDAERTASRQSRASRAVRRRPTVSLMTGEPSYLELGV